METGDLSQSVLAARFHPGRVLPLVPVDVPDHRGGFRRRLAVEGVGVGLELLVAGEARAHVVLVGRSLAQAGDENLPDAAIAAAHGMAADVPVVELAGDGDAFGVGRPHGEAHAGDAIGRVDVRAEGVPGFVERALGVQVEIGIGDSAGRSGRGRRFRFRGRPTGARNRYGCGSPVRVAQKKPCACLAHHAAPVAARPPRPIRPAAETRGPPSGPARPSCGRRAARECGRRRRDIRRLSLRSLQQS